MVLRMSRCAAPILVGALCLATWAVPASAKSARNVMQALDTNGDGVISRDEWRKPLRKFKHMDTDDSGTLTLDELSEFFRGAPRSAQSKPSTASSAGSNTRKWIDVHVHPSVGRGSRPDAWGAIAAAMSAMDANNIAQMVLMPQPMIAVMKSGRTRNPAPMERWMEEALKYPDRFAVMGGGGTLNAMIHDESADGNPSEELKQRFVARAEAILDAGAKGFGEIAVSHLSMVPGQHVMDVKADHPLLLILADLAAAHDAVIDVHFDPVDEDIARPHFVSGTNPSVLRRNMDAFERFLAHNREARISWAHAGSDRLHFWNAEFTREVLARHPNLFMSLRMLVSKSGLNYTLTSDGVEDDWLETFKQFPDRFFLGGDQFFLPPAMARKSGPGAKFARMSQGTRDEANRLLSYLPPDMARKFAYENAIRVYKLRKSARLAGP